MKQPLSVDRLTADNPGSVTLITRRTLRVHGHPSATVGEKEQQEKLQRYIPSYVT